jgi:hypothetical protein
MLLILKGRPVSDANAKKNGTKKKKLVAIKRQ